MIELLVVVSIIAILAPMLLPVLTKAREVAQRATCINNEKSMMLALFMYLDDYNEHQSLWGMHDGVNRPKVSGYLYPVAVAAYVGFGDIAEKPMNNEAVGDRFHTYCSKSVVGGPIYNSVLFCPTDTMWNQPSSVSSPLPWMRLTNFVSSWHGWNPNDDASTYQPTAAELARVTGRTLVSHKQSDTTMVFGHARMNWVYLQTHAINKPGTWNFPHVGPERIHGGTLPYAWLDGHVRTISASEMIGDYANNGALYGPTGASPIWYTDSFMPW